MLVVLVVRFEPLDLLQGAASVDIDSFVSLTCVISLLPGPHLDTSVGGAKSPPRLFCLFN